MKFPAKSIVVSFSLVALTLGCSKSAEETATVAATPGSEAQPEKAEAAAPEEHAGHEKAASSQPARPPGKGETVEDRNQVDDDKIVRRGEALTSAATLSVSDCISKGKELGGKSVKVEGTVAQVCAKKGCWFVLSTDGKDATPDNTIRITSKDYRFFVPTDAVGQKATIEGALEVKTMSIEEAQHMADDAAEAGGEPAPKVTEPQVEVRIAAVGVELRKGG